MGNIDAQYGRSKNKQSVDETKVVNNDREILKDGGSGDDSSDEDSESRESDIIVDEENLVDDVEVDVRKFHSIIAYDVELMPNNIIIVTGDDKDGSENEDMKVIDHTVFESTSIEDDHMRVKMLKKLR
ncbi:hypothetical protein L1887_39495 [Cichorium endivia]|nr:hypothetical protein L1887_39484 [Cichorium endivia]KAI3497104.1 hypothetical protein L1887_39488 [Cichorium endivia]KAI3497110.1 hypothetical protein L1887_39495 [Cichorium endivia]